MIETLDDFVEAIFEDEELFNGLCSFVGAMIKLTNARSEITEKALNRIYGIERKPE